MRVVYALTTGGRDVYSEMARVSMASVRATNPVSECVVVCDRQSAEALKNCSNSIVDEASELRVLDTFSESKIIRSRLLKIGVFDAIAGPFLYLDVDTFVQGDLEPIFQLDTDIACCRNANQTFREEEEIIAELGWPYRFGLYANSGAIFYSGTHGARRFSDAWRTKYLEGLSRAGWHFDQPSFNAVLADETLRVAILPNRYNAQFKVSPGAADGAIVLHFYGSVPGAQPTFFEKLVYQLVRGKPLEASHIRALIDTKSAWKRGVVLEGTQIRRLAGQVRNRLTKLVAE